MITAEISKWIMLILIIVLIIFIVKAGTKIINIIIMALILAFCWFSFFTEVGATRLSVALTGHPVIAYTTHLEKDTSKSNNEVSYYKVDKKFTFNGKEHEYATCNTYWVVRIPSVGEY